MKIAMLQSGGLDSFVTGGMLLRNGDDISAFCFDYGQPTAPNEWAAANVFVKWAKEHYPERQVTLRPLFLHDYSQFLKKNPIFSGNAPDATEEKKTIFIPGRNIVFLLYTAIAVFDEGITDIAYSALKTDISGDCQWEFTRYFEAMLTWGMGVNKKPVDVPYRVFSPLIEMDKAQVVSLSKELDLPVSMSWSCYREGAVHCGRCHACVNRRKGFEEAGVPDITVYAESLTLG